MTAAELLAFLRRHRLGVVATRAADGAPSAAVVGVAITDDLEIVFDTLADTRKLANLTADPRVAIVIGWDHEATAQLEGLADVPTGAEHDRILAAYLAVFPDGQERLAWPGITHVRVKITWARYSDFSQSPPRVAELRERAQRPGDRDHRRDVGDDVVGGRRGDADDPVDRDR